MAPKNYSLTQFEKVRKENAWVLVQEFESVDSAKHYAASPQGAWTRNPGTPGALDKIFAEAAAMANAIGQGGSLLALDRTDHQGHLSLLNRASASVLVWDFVVEGADVGECLARMAALAQGGRTDGSLRLVEQENRAFMWRAPLFHPMQARENVYQRVVQAAGRDLSGMESITAQSDALARFFQNNESTPAPITRVPPPVVSEARWASVRMNHLIETFYLFRLLVRYEVVGTGPIEDALRVELSGALTKLLHNGDRSSMGWLSQWLTEKVADLGARISALNAPGKKRVIFFLKGGRALNYYLGTPEKGENDWDTQVVIDPSLPAEEWYATFAEVHDVLLRALERYNKEFTDLLTQNVTAFEGYLRTVQTPQTATDDDITDNDVEDSGGHHGRASCKAELIDIGVPRRDTAAALEEWSELSRPGAILTSAGVNFPHRPYYVNEYLMMIREAFLPGADVHKAPKRIARLSLLLNTPRDESPAEERRRLQALPHTAEAIDSLPLAQSREIFSTIASQFVQAYSLAQDKGFAEIFDGWASALIMDPPPLSDRLVGALENMTPNERSLAGAVAVAHALSDRATEQSSLRNSLILEHAPFFDALLLNLRTQLEPLLTEVPAQFAVVGSYAARLHAQHLRLGGDGLEPVRRIVVHLQHPNQVPESTVMAKVRDAILHAIGPDGPLEPIPLGPSEDPKQRAVSLRWKEKVELKDGTAYQPLVLKIRASAQMGPQLPVLSAINGLPVLDLRFLADDYLRKSAKIHEFGMGKILSSASHAVLELMSAFDVSTIRESDPDDATD